MIDSKVRLIVKTKFISGLSVDVRWQGHKIMSQVVLSIGNTQFDQCDSRADKIKSYVQEGGGVY